MAKLNRICIFRIKKQDCDWKRILKYFNKITTFPDKKRFYDFLHLHFQLCVHPHVEKLNVSLCVCYSHLIIRSICFALYPSLQVLVHVVINNMCLRGLQMVNFLLMGLNKPDINPYLEEKSQSVVLA